MLTHYARTFDGLAYAPDAVDKLELREFSRPADRTCRWLEMGFYDATGKDSRGAKPARARAAMPEWIAGFENWSASRPKPVYRAALVGQIPSRRINAFTR